MLLPRLCSLRFRPARQVGILLTFIISVIAQLYLLTHFKVRLWATQQPHIIGHRYMAITKNARENSTNKLQPHAAFTHSHNIKHDLHFERYYANNASNQPALFNNWRKTLSSQCNGHFKGFGNVGAMLHDVVIDMSKCAGPKGGEHFQDLINQREEVEFLKYSPGFLSLPCGDNNVSYIYRGGGGHVGKWMDVLATKSAINKADEVIDDFTIAITRYEYVNIYHTMTDFYNAFLVMAFFNKTQHQTNILILDAHPKGSLDPVWGTVFNSMTRVSQLKPRTRFSNLVFGILGYWSPLFVSQISDAKNLVLAKEFREFFLSSYNQPLKYPLDCDKLAILLIWRRDYIAHPRNPSGSVQRKIKNEDELLVGIQQKYPTFSVRGVQMDRFNMGDQVGIVAKTDIIIGMHGAALSHMLFLHRGRAVIELMPTYITPEWRKHFIKMASQKGLIYRRWINTNRALEHPNHFTTVPPQVVNSKIAEVVAQMCAAAT